MVLAQRLRRPLGPLLPLPPCVQSRHLGGQLCPAAYIIVLGTFTAIFIVPRRQGPAKQWIPSFGEPALVAEPALALTVSFIPRSVTAPGNWLLSSFYAAHLWAHREQ